MLVGWLSDEHNPSYSILHLALLLILFWTRRISKRLLGKLYLFSLKIAFFYQKDFFPG